MYRPDNILATPMTFSLVMIF